MEKTRRFAVVIILFCICSLLLLYNDVLAFSLIHDLPYQRPNGVTYTDVLATRDSLHTYYAYYDIPANGEIPDITRYGFDWGISFGCNGPACSSPGYHLYMLTCDQNNSNCVDGYDTGTDTQVVGSSVGQPTCWDEDHVNVSRGFIWYNNYLGLCGVGDVAAGTLYGTIPPPPPHPSFSLIHDLPYQRPNGVTYTDVIATRDSLHTYYAYYDIPVNGTIPDITRYGFDWGISFGCNGPACSSPGYHLYMLTCDQNNNNCVDGYDTGTENQVVGSSVGQPTCWDKDHVFVSRGFIWYNNYSGLCGIGDVTAGTLYGTIPPPSSANLQVSPSPYNFGNQLIFTCGTPQEFTLSNTGNANINVTDVKTNLTVSNNKIFELIYDWGSSPCNQSNPTITPGGNCTVGATFCPATQGPVNDNLVITSNDPDMPIMNIQLTGTGTYGSGQSVWSYPILPYSPGSYAGRSFFYDSNHLGEDIKLQEKTPIHAIGSGVIKWYASATSYGELVAVVEHDLGKNYEFTNAYGNKVSTRYILSIYGHIRDCDERRGRKVCTKLRVGQSVTKDTIIGYVNDDRHNGDGSEHLHMGIRLSNAVTAKSRDGRFWFRGYERGTNFGTDFAAASEVISTLLNQ